MILSAGVILYRRANERIEVLLAHPGGQKNLEAFAGAGAAPAVQENSRALFHRRASGTKSPVQAKACPTGIE